MSNNKIQTIDRKLIIETIQKQDEQHGILWTDDVENIADFFIEILNEHTDKIKKELIKQIANEKDLSLSKDRIFYIIDRVE